MVADWIRCVRAGLRGFDQRRCGRGWFRWRNLGVGLAAVLAAIFVAAAVKAVIFLISGPLMYVSYTPYTATDHLARDPARETCWRRYNGVIPSLLVTHGFGGTVRGTIVEYATYEPVPFADVIVELTCGDRRLEKDTWKFWATTDSDGVVTLSGLPYPRFSRRRSGWHIDVLTTRLMGEGAIGSSQDVKGPIARLFPYSRADGRVVDESGNPVQGAFVRRMLMPWDEGVFGVNSEEELARVESDATKWFTGGYGCTGCVSDTYGRFSMLGHAKFPMWGIVQAEGYAVAPVRLPLGTSDTVVTLSRGRALYGRVVDAESGEPVPDLELLASGGYGGNNCQRVRSDPNGYFKFTGLAEEEYRITLNDDEYVLPLNMCFDAPVTKELDGCIRVRVTRPGRVTGVVVDDVTGQPPAGVAVHWTPHTEVSFLCQPPAITTQTGGFAGSGLTPGTYRVMARMPNRYVPPIEEWPTFTVRPGATAGPITVRLQSARRVSGTLLYPPRYRRPAATPARGIEVEAYIDEPRPRVEHTYTAEDGTFEFDYFHPGTVVTITIGERGYAPLQLGPVQLSEDIEFPETVLSRQGAFVGRLRPERGKSAPGIVVTAHAQDSGWVAAAETTTSVDGRFHFHELRPGSYIFGFHAGEAEETIGYAPTPVQAGGCRQIYFPTYNRRELVEHLPEGQRASPKLEH